MPTRSFFGEIKTALVMNSWIEEVSEEKLIQQFNVQPGDLYRIIENAKWLLHATDELAQLFGEKEVLPLTGELVERVSKGIKKELLPIVRLGRRRQSPRTHNVQRRLPNHRRHKTCLNRGLD